MVLSMAAVGAVVVGVFWMVAWQRPEVQGPVRPMVDVEQVFTDVRLGDTFPVLEPVGLPSHFVVGCYTDGLPFFIDPFERGLFRDPDELFALLRASHVVPQLADLAPTPVREVLCRSCRNLVNHYTAAGDAEHVNLFASFVHEFEATHERHSE